MVSFQCDGCADTVKKPKLDQHRQKCWSSFTCLDCSTTFRNQEYKSHTSCVSEAEKYQGALYKGPKKNQQQNPSSSTSAIATPETAPSPVPASATASTSNVHPSRLVQMEQPERPDRFLGAAGGGRGRGAARGGRGGFGGPSRGGYGGYGGYQQNQGEKSYASAMNKLSKPGGMRSWGASAESTPVPDTTTFNGGGANTEQAFIPLPPASASAGSGAEETRKKKGKKGDKGGTGSKANSKRPKDEAENQSSVNISQPTIEAAEPSSKKRKLDDSNTVSADTTAASNTDTNAKTVKKLRKRYTKLADKGGEMSLGDLVDALRKEKGDKEPGIDSVDVLRSLKVAVKDGAFTVSI